MAGMELPYWRCYAAETLSDSRFQGWSLEERGAFWTLLNVQWREGGIPADMTSLAKLLHVDSSAMRSLWSNIGNRFVPHPDRPGELANPRMEEARDEGLAAMAQKKRAGKAGAESRWRSAKRANGGRMAVPSQTDGEESKAEQSKAEAPRHAAASAAEVDAPPRKLEVVDEGGGEPTPYPWPLAAAFRQALTDRMARTVPYPIGGQEPKVMGSLDASLAVVPMAEAVELCRARIVAASAANERRVPGTLLYFAQVLADEAMKRQIGADMRPKTRVCIGADDNGQPIYAKETR